MESLSRVRLVLGGIPRQQCNPWLQLSTGEWVRPDMIWPELKMIAEYNGNHHHTPQQIRRDESRYSKLRSDGYNVLVLNKDEVWPPEKLVARVRREMSRCAS